jgi:hypothetical protein
MVFSAAGNELRPLGERAKIISDWLKIPGTGKIEHPRIYPRCSIPLKITKT